MSPGGHCISMSCRSRYFQSSRSPTSHRSHYMNYTQMASRLSHCRSFDLHWALRATIWTTCRSRSFLSFWVLSEPREPLNINVSPFYELWSPMSRRSHCVNLCLCRHSVSPVSCRSHYMNYTWMACRLRHCRPSWSPMSPESRCMNDL